MLHVPVVNCLRSVICLCPVKFGGLFPRKLFESRNRNDAICDFIKSQPIVSGINGCVISSWHVR